MGVDSFRTDYNSIARKMPGKAKPAKFLLVFYTRIETFKSWKI